MRQYVLMSTIVLKLKFHNYKILPIKASFLWNPGRRYELPGISVSERENMGVLVFREP